MSKNKNPKLKEGDRIVLIYMPGEDVDTGTKGKVRKITPQPSFGTEFDYMYDVEWYDEDDKVISTLSLIPQSDTWNLGKTRIEKLCDGLKDIGVPWTMMGRIDTSTPEMYKKMVDSGCVGMRFGIESFNQELSNNVKKKLDTTKAYNNLKYIVTNFKNMEFHFTTMKNLPGEKNGSWENYNGLHLDESIDQIQNLINDLKTNPDSRRLMVSAWNVGELDQMVLPPCHYGFQVYTRELSKSERYVHLRTGKYSGKWDGTGDEMEYYNSIGVPKRAISLMWNQRSCDVPLGIPMNIASYGLLLMMIADEVNMIPEELIGNLGDCHIYLNQMDGVKEQIGREFSYEERLELIKDNKDFLVKLSSYSSNEDVMKLCDEFLVPRRTREPFELPTVHVRDGIHCSSVNDVILKNYQSHSKIYFPLSN